MRLVGLVVIIVIALIGGTYTAQKRIARDFIPSQSPSPAPSSTPVCGLGNTKVLVPDPAICKVVCEVPFVRGSMKDGRIGYWRQGAMKCEPKCDGEWELVAQEWTDVPECNGRPVAPAATPTPVAQSGKKK